MEVIGINRHENVLIHHRESYSPETGLHEYNVARTFVSDCNSAWVALGAYIEYFHSTPDEVLAYTKYIYSTPDKILRRDGVLTHRDKP